MTCRHQLLAQAATRVLGSSISLFAFPLESIAQTWSDRVVVTGSHVLRTDTETAAPVEIITREQIERTGKPTIAEVLRAIPSNTGASYDEAFTLSFAPGSSGISLRGLGQKATLVLLNGRRVAGYGFAQNVSDTFVDLNSIPSSAVDRVEILKDGASAIYGSDAIAGVVNIILRRDFRGFEGAAEVGYFDDKLDYRASVGVGFGDPNADKFNVFALLDYYRREELMASDTRTFATRDARRYQGGRNFQSVNGGGTWQNVVGTANGRPILGNERRAISDCRRHGRVINFAEALELGFQLPAAQNLPFNTWCMVDINRVLTALPGTERIGTLVHGTVEIALRTLAYGELALNRVETKSTFTPPFFGGAQAWQATPVGLVPFVYNVTFAPGVAGNPFATNARFAGNVYALGTRDFEITSDTARLLTGIRYAAGKWEVDSAIAYSRNEAIQEAFRTPTLSGTSAVFNVPLAAQPPEPTSTATNCNLDLQYSSIAGCGAALTDLRREARSELTLVDTKANREVGRLAGGPVGLAVGVEFREESLRDSFDPRVVAGDIMTTGSLMTEGRRSSVAGFAELALPLARTVEMQVAGRDDYYSDFGNAFVPKVGLKFKPSKEVLLRANWGRGFRAPTLPETSVDSVYFGSVLDPQTNTNVSVRVRIAGSPDLKPERSRNTHAGFVLAPAPDFSFSVDYYDIAWTDVVVGGDDVQAIVNDDFASRQAGGAGDPRVLRDPATNQIVAVFVNYHNVSRIETGGYDVDLRGAVRSAIGRFSARVNAAYVTKYKEAGFDWAGSNGGSYTIPRLKAAFELSWERGPAFLSARARHVHRFDQARLPASFFTPQDPRFQTGTYPRKVPSYTTYDLVLRASVTSNLTVNGTILNVTNEMPPYDPAPSDGFGQYDNRDRTYRVGVKYRF